MADYVEKYADKASDELEKQIKRVYKQAAEEVQKKLDDFIRAHKARDAEMTQKVASGELSEQNYKKWMQGQVFQGKQWRQKLKDVTDVYVHADEKAREIVGKSLKNVFMESANYTAYDIEKGMRGAVAFNVYDAKTVERLLKDNPKMLPEWKIDQPKDYTWNEKRVRNAVTQGIIQGESIEKVGSRLTEELATSNAKKMDMFARTAVNGAQNAGRMDRLHEAEDMGIEVRKKWLATLDRRTRDTHQALDGQEQPIDEPFVVDGMKIDYPGDPFAPPELVYNCRCTLTYVYPKYQHLQHNHERRDQLNDKNIENMTYYEWLGLASKNDRNQKEPKPTESEQATTPVQKEIEFDPDIGKTPREVKEGNLKKLGYKQSEIDDVVSLLDKHTDGYEAQKKADNEILQHIENNDKIGQLLRDKAELEIQAWEKKVKESKNEALREFNYKVESAKRDLEPGGIYSNYTEQDLKDWGVWPEEPDIQEPRFYRKGKVDKDVLAFTTLSSGAGMSYLTDGEDGYIGWDVTYTLSEMLDMGYRPVAGIMSADVGRPGEGEVLFVKFDEKEEKTAESKEEPKTIKSLPTRADFNAEAKRQGIELKADDVDEYVASSYGAYDLSDRISRFIDNAPEAMKVEASEIYRGLSFDNKRDFDRFIADHQEGDMLKTHRDGLSWTTDKSVAEEFSKNASDYSVILVNEDDKRNAISISNISDTPASSSEVLYSSTTDFEVVDVKRNGNFAYVYVTEAPVQEPKYKVRKRK